MPRRTIPLTPPPIAGVRRSFVDARGVSFHVTEAGDPDGLPVLALHGWPQHHYAWRDLLADPPEGVRIIAPDLPGYGWSGAAPHDWAKEEVASDVLALMDALGLTKVTLLAHDWGGWIGYLMALRAPERFHAYAVVNMAHLWQPPLLVARHSWRLLQYQPAMALLGRQLMRHTPVLDIALRMALTDKTAMSAEDRHWFADRFRDPVNARAGRDTYRTFLLREMPLAAFRSEQRRMTVPVRVLFGTEDVAIDPSMVAKEHANADDYEVELIDGHGHFLPDERPDLVRAHLLQVIRDFVPVATVTASP